MMSLLFMPFYGSWKNRHPVDSAIQLTQQVNSDFDWIVIFPQLILKLGIFMLKSLFISCEFNIHDVNAFYEFLRQLQNHHPVDSTSQSRSFSPEILAIRITMHWGENRKNQTGLPTSQTLINDYTRYAK